MRPLFGLILTVALACTPASPATPAAPAATPESRAERQALNVAVGIIPASLSPQIAPAAFAYLNWPMFDNLTQFGPGFEVKPSVAERWDLAADGLSWRFTIRRDMTWPDGSALTARDVAFTLNQAIEGNWQAKPFFTTVTGSRVIDDTTLEVGTRQADVSIPANGAFLWIVQQKYFESVGADGFREKPQGSGPYEIAEFRNAELVRYARRSAKHAFRAPVAETVTLRQITETNQRINGLKTGDLDISNMGALTGDTIDDLKRSSLVPVGKVDSILMITIPQGTYETRSTALKDKRVRQALNYAVDRVAIAQTLYKDPALALGQLAVPDSPSFDPDLKAWATDVALAKRLLAEAGYANGLKLTLELTPAQGANDVAVIVQGYLKEAGIEVEIAALEPGAFVDKATGRNNAVKGDLSVLTSSDNNGFATALRTYLGCGRPFGGGPGSTYYCNPAWDAALDAAYGERDAAKRTQLLRQASRILREDVPAIYLVGRPAYVVHTAKVSGFAIPVTGHFNYDTAVKLK